MENYRQPPIDSDNKDRTLLRVLMAGIGCLFIIAAFIAILFGRFLFSGKGPNRVVETHLEALNNGNYDRAYGDFDQRFRNRTSLKEFRSQIQAFSPFLPFQESNLNSVHIVNRRAEVDGILTGRNGTIFPVHYELTKRDDGWKITSYEWTSPGSTITL